MWVPLDNQGQAALFPGSVPVSGRILGQCGTAWWNPSFAGCCAAGVVCDGERFPGALLCGLPIPGRVLSANFWCVPGEYIFQLVVCGSGFRNPDVRAQCKHSHEFPWCSTAVCILLAVYPGLAVCSRCFFINAAAHGAGVVVDLSEVWISRYLSCREVQLYAVYTQRKRRS